MTSDRINEVYYGKIMSAQAQAVAQARTAWICQRVRGLTVLDIGCSQGIVSILLARTGKKVTGIDILRESIEYAKKELALESDSTRELVTLIHGDALQQAFEEDSYDTVIMGQLIENAPEPEAFLELARRVCKLGGKVIITTPFGLHVAADHIHTFYMYQFATIVSRFFILKEIDIVGKRICFLGEPRKTNSADVSDTRPLIDEQWHRRLHELSAAEFLRLENEKHMQLLDRANRIEKLQSEIEELESDKKGLHSRVKELADNNQKLQSEIEELENDKQTLQNRIIVLQNEHSQHINILRASFRYRIGDSMVSATKSLRGATALPFRLWHIYRDYRHSKKHLSGQANVVQNKITTSKRSTFNMAEVKIPPVGQLGSLHEARILFMPTNGAGLGHVTRLLAIARRMRTETRVKEIVFLTTSEALNIFRQEGFVAYHFPSPDRLKDKLTQREWNGCFQKLLEMTFINHDINVFIFDGVFAYSAITKTIQPMANLRKIWVRRGMLKEGVEDRLRDAEKLFDVQIIPGELGQENISRDSKGRITIPPIIFLDRKELLSREEAIRTLGLDSEKKTVFIQLGAGNINEIEAQIEVIVDTILKFDVVQVVLANSMIAQKRFSGFENIKIIRDYPLSRYYNAFDIAVSAAGYNTLAELIYFGVPSIFIPNLETASDDQLARANICENTGAGLVLCPLSISKLREDFDILLDDAKNAEFRKKCSILCPTSGSETAARILVEFIFSESTEYKTFKIN